MAIELSEEIKQNIAEFVERLEESSLKHKLTKRNESWKAQRGDEVMPDVWRQPEEVVGFLSKEKLQELMDQNDDRQLLTRCGVTIISDGEAYFLADDNCYGYDVFGRTFTGCTFGSFQHSIGEHARFKDLDAWLAHFCRGEKYLGSVEELAKYCLRVE